MYTTKNKKHFQLQKMFLSSVANPWTVIPGDHLLAFTIDWHCIWKFCVNGG